MFQKLLFAKNFQSNNEIRDNVSIIIEQILSPWDGTVADDSKNTVKSLIERADACGRNTTFKWYVNSVIPLLRQQASKEGKLSSFDGGDSIKYPISCLL